MIKRLYLSLCVVLAAAGVLMAASVWMREYAAQPVDPRHAKAPTGDAIVHPEDLPKLYPVGDFSFTEHRGGTFTQENLKGKVWAGYLFFTACPSQCPIMTSNMKKVSERFAGNDKVHFVGVSVDPDTDTTERLTQYAGQYQIDTPQWHLLHGSRDAVNAMAGQNFKLGSVERPEFHSDRFVLIDAEGQVRGYFTGTEDEDLPKLGDAVERLLNEMESAS
jgi:protein SCO1/2